MSALLNYNPFTGEKHGDGDGYGPTILAFFEYVSLMYGVNIACEKATDLKGNILSIYGIGMKKGDACIEYQGKVVSSPIGPNEEAVIEGDILKVINRVDFKENDIFEKI